VLRRRLPPPFHDVELFVSSEAGLRFLKPSLKEVDPPLLAFARRHVTAGHVVWDVGANIGLFTFAATALGASVIALEPDSYNVRMLLRSADRLDSRFSRPTVVPVAVSDTVGFARFDIARRNRSTNHLKGFGSTQTGGCRQTLVVPTTTLDELLERFPPPAVLKIDVEGAEVNVLRGARSVVAHHPAIFCEVEPACSAEVADILRPYGYEFFDGDDGFAPSVLPPYSTLALPTRAG
jgi:FkbM family methyltransferase